MEPWGTNVIMPLGGWSSAFQMQDGNTSCLPTARDCREEERRKELENKTVNKRCGCGIASIRTHLLGGRPVPQEAEFLIHPNSYLLGESHLGAPALPHLQVGTWEAGLNKHILGTGLDGVAGEPRAPFTGPHPGARRCELHPACTSPSRVTQCCSLHL